MKALMKKIKKLNSDLDVNEFAHLIGISTKLYYQIRDNKRPTGNPLRTKNKNKLIEARLKELLEVS